MNLAFHAEPFPIPDEYKITLWRYNVGGTSPLSPHHVDVGAVKWDKKANAVYADPPGFFCVQDGQIQTGYGYYTLLGFIHQTKVKFLKIEADRRDILFVSADEVAVSRGNIVETLSHKQFGRRFPVLPYVVNLMYRNGGIALYREGCSMIRDYYKDIERSVEEASSNEGGYVHSLRVEKGIHLLGGKLGIGQKERESVKDFAYWHDVMRAHGTPDPAHGKRAAEAIERTKGRNKFKQVDTNKLIFACEHHSTMLRSDDPLVDICFDADRLDLMMIGINPDPAMMATDIGAYYAEHYDEYSAALKNMSV